MTIVLPSPRRPEVDCLACPIRHRAVCARCDDGELGRLEAMKSYRTYAPGEAVARAGEELGFVGSVVRGAATLAQTMPDGRRQMVGLLLPSDFVGRPGRAVLPYDVEAATEVVLCRFGRAPFEAMLRESPHVAGRLLEMALDELDAARDWMRLLGRKTARERVASLLAIAARRGSPAGGPVAIDLPLTREAMADYLGLTLETVSRQVGALRRDGVIALEGLRRVVVPDLGRLLAETGDGPGEGS